MAFGDLNESQRRLLIRLIEEISSGDFAPEFLVPVTRRRMQGIELPITAGQVQGITLLGLGKTKDKEFPEPFDEGALFKLSATKYLTLTDKGSLYVGSLTDKAYKGYSALKESLVTPSSMSEPIQDKTRTIDIFISHSSKDKAVAEALINLLRDALSIPASSIRCTSVDGYRLPAGASTDEQLRQEIYAAKVFLGLITPTSFQSTYVLFELGARWGARLPLAPVLASGADASTLRAPLSGLNALSCDEPAQVHQLLDNIASLLGANLGSAASFQRYIDALVQQSKAGKEQADSERARASEDQELTSRAVGGENPAKRAYVIERLKELVRLHGQLPASHWVEMDDPRADTMRAYYDGGARFFSQYFDEDHVKRFQDRGIYFVEELLKEYMS